MSIVTLRPSADGTTTGWTRVPASGTFAAKIVDDPDSNDGDTSFVISPNVVSGTMFVELDDVPADFDPDAINSITIKVAHRRLNTPNMAVDLGTVNSFLTRADETTAISTTPTEVSSPIQVGYALTSFTPSPTGTHTVTEWNGARLALVFTHTNSQSADTTNQIRITAAEVTIDYTPAAGEPTTTPQAIAATAVGTPVLARTVTYSRAISATAVGAAVVARTTTYLRAMAATAIGAVVLTPAQLIVKALAATAVGVAKLSAATLALVGMSATAVGVASLSAATIFAQVVSATAIGVATLAAEFIEGVLGATKQWLAHMAVCVGRLMGK